MAYRRNEVPTGITRGDNRTFTVYVPNKPFVSGDRVTMTVRQEDGRGDEPVLHAGGARLSRGAALGRTFHRRGPRSVLESGLPAGGRVRKPRTGPAGDRRP